MVNKDQLEQSEEGRQVLALMADNFSAEEFQPALTLIEQLYTEEQAIWDAGLNHESKWPFVHTNPARRIVVFFEHPEHVRSVKDELLQRHVAAAIHAEVPVVKIKLVRKPARSSAKARKPKKKKAKPAKKKMVKAAKKKTKRVQPKKKSPVRRKPARKTPTRKPTKKKRR